MKLYTIIIAALLLVSILSDGDKDYCKGEDATNKKDCEKLKIEGKRDDGENFTHCCYLEGETDSKDLKACIPLTDSEYKDIKKYIKDAENASKEKDAKIKSLDCNSYYLKISLLTILLILF